MYLTWGRHDTRFHSSAKLVWMTGIRWIYLARQFVKNFLSGLSWLSWLQPWNSWAYFAGLSPFQDFFSKFFLQIFWIFIPFSDCALKAQKFLFFCQTPHLRFVTIVSKFFRKFTHFFWNSVNFLAILPNYPWLFGSFQCFFPEFRCNCIFHRVFNFLSKSCIFHSLLFFP